MKHHKLQEMSNEALLQRLKTTQVVTSTLAGLLTVLLIMAIYVWINVNPSIGLPLVVVALSLSTIVFINIAHVRAVRKELQSRNHIF